MNQAASLPRVNPWIVVALMAVVTLLTLLAVSAVVLLVEPGVLHAIRATLHGPQQMAPQCPGSIMTC
jgi:hypothetical protein